MLSGLGVKVRAHKCLKTAGDIVPDREKKYLEMFWNVNYAGGARVFS
jgi:hypothetical protein